MYLELLFPKDYLKVLKMFCYKKNKKLYTICKQNKIPIIRKKTAIFINKIINKNHYQTMLEIGTAYGFSVSLWIQNKHLEKIISIEKIESNFEIAKKYVKSEKLELINTNAFEWNCDKKFDLIFIDGPKSHQENLIEKFLPLLNKKGTIIIDNLELKKFKNKDFNSLTKNQKKLLIKLNNFKSYLINNKKFNYKFKNIDDGVGIIKWGDNE